jgi:hypothetical protein
MTCLPQETVTLPLFVTTVALVRNSNFSNPARITNWILKMKLDHHMAFFSLLPTYGRLSNPGHYPTSLLLSLLLLSS